MATKTELFAWRNKGYDDAVAGRPIPTASRNAPASARSAYFEGRRAGLNEKAASSRS